MIGTYTTPQTSLEKEINYILTSGQINHQDRIWFLLASLWDKCLTEKEQAGIREIFYRLKNGSMRVLD